MGFFNDYCPKKEGKVRVCIDPRDLNNVIKRCHYPLPTLEEVVTRLANAKVFSVFDAKSGFWQVKLGESSCKLTTFYTLFGRYYLKRIPFGIRSTPEVWQRKAHEFVEGLEGVEVIIDDFLIGYGDTVMATVENHKNLIGFLERARVRNLTLNPEKDQLCLEKVVLMDHRLTANGLIADPAKVEAIMNMPTPTNVKSLRALGMANYLTDFLLSCDIQRQLEHKGLTV